MVGPIDQRERVGTFGEADRVPEKAATGLGRPLKGVNHLFVFIVNVERLVVLCDKSASYGWIGCRHGVDL